MKLRVMVLGLAAGMVVQLFSVNGAAAEGSTGRRGLITTATCPFDCAMAGVAKQSCRSWQAGDECYVEDLSQAPGHRSLLILPEGTTAPRSAASQSGSRMRRDGQGTWITVPSGKSADSRSALGAPATEGGKRGLVTSARCPFDCDAAAIPQAQCRSWTDGELCYVEDLLQAPGHRSMLSVQ